ncbi:unnamed protein product [Ilex paraguariensis]|uniref:Uncharacterized protein n=1 Tax=Ilex paraguariensis TaxID=185542 RepID=A0ABC8TLP3_9AQUA
MAGNNDAYGGRPVTPSRYTLCLRNQTARFNGANTLDGCHRNIHRKVVAGPPIPNHQATRSHLIPHPAIIAPPAPPPPLPSARLQPPISPEQVAGVVEEEEEMRVKKKAMTKLTEEQKEKMKHDEEDFFKLCNEIGFTPPVLKNWISYNRRKMEAGRASSTP